VDAGIREGTAIDINKHINALWEKTNRAGGVGGIAEFSNHCSDIGVIDVVKV
jgi:hypothetical protein